MSDGRNLIGGETPGDETISSPYKKILWNTYFGLFTRSDSISPLCVALGASVLLCAGSRSN